MSKEIIYNKLVRDKMPEVIEKAGKDYKAHIASNAEYKGELLKKLKEETSEFIESPCEEEVADILEVIDALVELYGFSIEKIKEIKYKKGIERGGFKEKVILESVIEKD